MGNNINHGNLEKSIFGNKNSVNNSFNTILNNYKIEINNNEQIGRKLERANMQNDIGSEVECYGYVIHKYSDEIYENNYYRITLLNIHKDYIYYSDHIQMMIPITIYDEKLINSIIHFKGIVYSYDNNRGYSIKLTELIDVVNHLKLGNMNIKYTDDTQNIIFNLFNKFYDDRSKLFDKLVHVINGYFMSNGIPCNFIPNFIFTQYYLNLRHVYLANNTLHKTNLVDSALNQFILLITSLLFKTVNGSINTIEDCMTYIIDMCSFYQGISSNPFLIKKSKHMFKEYPELPKFIEDNKLENVDIGSMFVKIRNRVKYFSATFYDPKRDFDKWVDFRNDIYLNSASMLRYLGYNI